MHALPALVTKHVTYCVALCALLSGAFPRDNGHVSHSEQKSESLQAVLLYSVLLLLESEIIFLEGLRLGAVVEFASCLLYVSFSWLLSFLCHLCA